MPTTTETTTTFTKLNQIDISDIEKKLQSKLKSSKNFISKTYHRALFYWDAIKTNLADLWQYEEFRLGVYIFWLLSVIPAAFFLLFVALVVLISTVLVSFLWSFIVFSAIAIGLMILVPVLMGCSVTVGFLMAGYYVYQYLLRLKQANKKCN